MNTDKLSFIAIIAVLIAAVATLIFVPMPREVRYDCSLSEISPDFPEQVKNECRKLRAENFQNSLQKPK